MYMYIYLASPHTGVFVDCNVPTNEVKVSCTCTFTLVFVDFRLSSCLLACLIVHGHVTENEVD